jgi:hypothetical protein
MSAMIRDRRGENAMAPETRDIHERLMGWAMWCASERSGQSGAVSTIARMMKYGVHGAGSGDAPIEMPSHIEAVDQGVALLPHEERHIVTHLYVACEPFEAIAHELGLSIDRVKYLLRYARRDVASFLRAWSQKTPEYA